MSYFYLEMSNFVWVWGKITLDDRQAEKSFCFDEVICACSICVSTMLFQLDFSCCGQERYNEEPRYILLFLDFPPSTLARLRGWFSASEQKFVNFIVTVPDREHRYTWSKLHLFSLTGTLRKNFCYFPLPYCCRRGLTPWQCVSFIPIYYVFLLLCRSRIDTHMKFHFDVKIDDATHTQGIF